ncbi:hypothetical protein Misp01_36820 [Microtetraspora sp. NBRC 13810]|uniref:DUF3800 domain-containing protein n=1 Tax=Microtetraspora sp. NBRC 13810 TaxID=3030990 RepID=UPI0024A5265B|nr:DUF3800 domain-containing protein [Microtetraspora sp. NBRC 13810]GLW08552.1 hypothetical protein Misp01_36820 [Microtetraspora sp. NBRC 13810]
MGAEFLEIACDESGSEGDRLIGGNTDVFAHAGVRLSGESAAECVLELRRRIRSPATEYKAGHLLRAKHRGALEWLLGPDGPLRGNARVHLVDKTFYAVGRVVELAVGEFGGPGRDDARALVLYREGGRVFGRDRWQAFLESFNDVMRGRMPTGPFFHMVGGLTGGRGPIGEIMESLAGAGPRADAFLARLAHEPGMTPVLNPFVGAVMRAIVHWGAGERPVLLVHDEHDALTARRIALLEETFAGPFPAPRLAGVRLVDSRSDPRVQVADFLAGVARKIASDELAGRGDADLTALLRPHVDASSAWGDDRTRALLLPTP